MFKGLRSAIVSLLQMFIPPPNLPAMRCYTFPDHDRVALVENYATDTYYIKAETIPYKNKESTLE